MIRMRGRFERQCYFLRFLSRWRRKFRIWRWRMMPYRMAMKYSLVPCHGRRTNYLLRLRNLRRERRLSDRLGLRNQRRGLLDGILHPHGNSARLGLRQRDGDARGLLVLHGGERAEPARGELLYGGGKLRRNVFLAVWQLVVVQRVNPDPRFMVVVQRFLLRLNPNANVFDRLR